MGYHCGFRACLHDRSSFILGSEESSFMSGNYKEDDGSLGEAQINGLTLIFRARSKLPSIPDRQIHENLIVISWRYAANEWGMPDREDNQNTIRFEEAIEKPLWSKDLAFKPPASQGTG